MNNYSGSPYYSRYMSQHKDKGYTAVLAKPGLAEQASEFNEIQAIQRDYLERLGKSIYKDGAIISGCEINIDGTHVTIGKGSIFLDGLVRDVTESHLTISGVGSEIIMASVSSTIVTVVEDSSLRDPAQGAENYGLEGADREKQIVTLSVISGTGVSLKGAELYTLEDGKLPVVVSDLDTTNNLVTTDILAERTFDENGSYKVNGILLRNLPELVGNKIRVYITEGKAYVRGYGVTRDAVTSVLLDQSTDTRKVQSESIPYSSTKRKYELSNSPVASVVNVTAVVSVIGEMKYRSSIAGGYEALNKTPVHAITRVYEKDASNNITKTYVKGRDYRLYNNQIDWSPSGDEVQEPARNSVYYVDYTYNKDMSSSTDYTIENSGGSSYFILQEGGSRPEENEDVYITYNYTLARRDLILMDAEGEISVLKGQPDEPRNLMTPYNGSKDFLELGYVDVYPTDLLNSQIMEGIADVVNYNSVRFTQESLYTLLQRINTIEDDLATLDLERDIEEGEDIASLNGYFTDSFRNINKSDLGYRSNIDGKLVSYTACIDYDTEELTTAADIESQDLVINDDSSDDYAIYGTVISAPYVEELALKQTYVTGTMLVNPYASYGPLCKVILNPSSDNWVDTETVKVQNTITKETYTYQTKTYSHGYWSRNATKNLRGYMGSKSTTTTTYTGTSTTSSTSTSVAETLYEYMREKTIEVEGQAFLGNMTNIYCTFNKIPVDIIAGSDTTQGTNVTVSGKSVRTVNPNDNGHFTGTITVPANVPCGTVDVEFIGTNSLGETYSGKGLYSSVGTLLTTTITNTTVIEQRYKVLTVIDNLYKSDPLAQSFVLDTINDRVLTKIGVYFATKSSTRPAVLQVRNMVNGYPGESVYAEVTIKPENVNIPTNPEVPVVTNISLNQPVYCKAGVFYCFVILSDSNAYSMYYAEMGNNILGTSQQLVINPYGTGVMFSSSNASTWTAHQGSDLKFELYRSRYTGSGEIIFDEASIDAVTGILLDAAYEDNNNVGIKWYYRYNTGTTYSSWFPVDTLTFRELGNTTDKIILKAVITTDFSTSPYIDSGRVSLRAFIDQKEATYISKHLTEEDFEEPYTALKITYQAAIPLCANHEVYYMDVQDGSWVKLEYAEGIVDIDIKPISEEFAQYTWTIKKIHKVVEDSTSTGSTFFKARIDLSTSLAYERPRIKRFAAIFKYSEPGD